MTLNVRWQILATLTFPSSIYAFHRIKKLKYGILIITLGNLLSASSIMNITSLIQSNNLGLYFYISWFIAGYSIFLPMLYMRKWTTIYNSKLLEHTTTKPIQ